MTDTVSIASLNMPINDRKAMEALMEELGVVVKREQKRSTKSRAEGFWIPYAWMVRAIMEHYLTEPSSRTVTKSGKLKVAKVVRVVLRRAGIKVSAKTENCLRVVYYGVRDRQWPIGMKEMLGIASTITEDEEILDTTPIVIPIEEVEEDYLDDELRAELLAEEESRRIAAEEAERRLVSQIAMSRGDDPDMDEGYTPDNEL